ncbi:hypothetical protein BMS3Abin02_01019 [bacterium BMS3Abin02]|nr:hypothetical protein BMS3Abin02_01019 [bacterium BMS3Abin02]
MQHLTSTGRHQRNAFAKTSFIAVVATLLLISGMSPAAAKSKTGMGGMSKMERVRLLTARTGALVEGDSAWIQVLWQSIGADADNFKVTVKNPEPGWEIRYPENTGSYTSLMADATLSDGEIDFTAIHITVPYDTRRNVTLGLTVTYTSRGTPHSSDFIVRVPVTSFSGTDLAQVTTDVTTVGTAGWISIGVLGNAPRLDNVRMTVSPPPGIVVTYPAGRIFTSLAHDARLEDGESDYAAFHLDVSGVKPGTYELPLQITYTKDATAGTWNGTVTLQVATP